MVVGTREALEVRNNTGSKITLLIICAVSTACSRAAFDSQKPQNPVPTETQTPSSETSRIRASSPSWADGATATEVILEIRDKSGNAISGVVMALSVTGSGNVASPCSATDQNGMSSCRVFSTVPELKTIEAKGTIRLVTQSEFRRLPNSPSTFGVVSAGEIAELPSGHRIISSVGIVETPYELKDSNGIVRLRSSLQRAFVEE